MFVQTWLHPPLLVAHSLMSTQFKAVDVRLHVPVIVQLYVAGALVYPALQTALQLAEKDVFEQDDEPPVEGMVGGHGICARAGSHRARVTLYSHPRSTQLRVDMREHTSADMRTYLAMGVT